MNGRTFEANLEDR